ncbi:helix-turn-helix domain-containing protein [Halobacteriales archaeon QS_8_69_26]|nr:MAG: helix-turn-helix domain-containing protein [Halobacteriales archaeon QS_8_69_26]
MIDVILDVRQYDCPFVETTDEHPLSFSASHWEYDPGAARTEVRMVAEAPESGALTAGLRTLRDHPCLRSCELVSKRGTQAELDTVVDETAAMAVVQAHDGYITAPFYVEDGSELWHVGFDDDATVDEALVALEAENDFVVESREEVDEAAVGGVIRNADAASALLDGCRALTDVERATLETAVAEGYFDTPRGITLGELADEFGVSKPAVSKNLRRGQRKLLERAVDAIGDMDDFP